MYGFTHYLKSGSARGTILALCIAMISMLSITASAQLDWSVEVTNSMQTTFTGESDSQMDGVAAYASGSSTIVYFADSQSGYDAVTRWDGTTLTTFATEDELDPYDTGSPNASFADMTVDQSGTFYILLSGTGYEEVIWRVPGDDFSNAVSMLTDPDRDEAAEIAVDEANSRLIIAYNDYYGDVGPSFGEGIGWIALDATDATVNELASESDLQAVIDAIPGSSQGDIDPFDVCALSDGTVLVSHGFSSNAEENGSILKIAPGGNVSLLISGAGLISLAGGDPGAIDIGNVHINRLSDDRILAHVGFTSDDEALEPFIALSDPNGSNWQVLATQSDVLADPDMSAFDFIGDLDGKHGGVDANDNYWWHQQSPNGIIKMTGFPTYVAPTAAQNHWNLYE